MESIDNNLTVKATSELCRVGRSTVTYWIRSKKVQAVQSGNKYVIPVESLRSFLKSSGKHIPFELENGSSNNQPHKIPACYEFWKDSNHGSNCQTCLVQKHQLDLCFTAQKSHRWQCPTSCYQCHYFQHTYWPIIEMVNQFDCPAGVYKDFYLLGGNSLLAEICGVSEEKLVGMGLEKMVHHDSVEEFIGFLRAKTFGEPTLDTKTFFLKDRNEGKIKVTLFVFPLNQIPGSFILLTEPISE